GQLVNRDNVRSVLLRHRRGIGDVIAVPVRQQDVVDLRWQLETLRVLRILCNEGIDQDVGSLGGLDQDSCVSQPGNARRLRRAHKLLLVESKMNQTVSSYQLPSH